MKEQMHPEDLAAMICDLAKQHGYGITDLCFVGRHLTGGVVPEYRYECDPIVDRKLDGTGTGYTSPMKAASAVS